MSQFDGTPRVFRVGADHQCIHAAHARSLQHQTSTVWQESCEQSNLWTEGNLGSNETDLHRSLLCRHDTSETSSDGKFIQGDHLFGFLAGVDAPSVLWVAREIGGAGGIDVAALLQSKGERSLLLIDCKNASAASRLDLVEQDVQAQRLLIATLSNLWFCEPPKRVKLVLLSGLSSDPYTPLPWFSVGTGADDPIVEIESWCMRPFKRDGLDYVAFGRRSSVATSKKRNERPPKGKSPSQPHAPFSLRCHMQDSRISAIRLGVAADVDKGSRALPVDAGKIIKRIVTKRKDPRSSDELREEVSQAADGLRTLRARLYEDPKAVDGYEFVGESNEKGRVRLQFHAASCGNEPLDDDDEHVVAMFERELKLPREFFVLRPRTVDDGADGP